MPMYRIYSHVLSILVIIYTLKWYIYIYVLFGHLRWINMHVIIHRWMQNAVWQSMNLSKICMWDSWLSCEEMNFYGTFYYLIYGIWRTTHTIISTWRRLSRIVGCEFHYFRGWVFVRSHWPIHMFYMLLICFGGHVTSSPVCYYYYYYWSFCNLFGCALCVSYVVNIGISR